MSKFDDLRIHLRAIRTLARGVTHGLPLLEAAADPYDLFGDWFRDAEASGLLLPESMALATATGDGRPSVRMVLLKGFGPAGFRFFTNYGSRKAAELDENPRASLCFHWSVLERQVRIEGRVERLSAEDSAAYFATRDHGSRIGAWASAQSRPIADRAGLEAQRGGGGGPVRGEGRAPARLLGRIRPRSRPDRVLAGPFEPAARPSRIHAAPHTSRRKLEDRPPPAVSERVRRATLERDGALAAGC